MKHILFSMLFSCSLLGMQKPASKIEEEKRKNQEMHIQILDCIEKKVAEDAIIDWPELFKNRELATPEQHQEYRQKLLQKVSPLLFPLANRLGHREFLDAAQLQSTDDGKKIITRDECALITMPEGVPNRIALNASGNSLAIHYANTVQVISKKNQWGNHTSDKKQRYPVQSLAFYAPAQLAFTSENSLHSLDVKTKELKVYKKPSFGKNILICPNGKYLLYDLVNAENSIPLLALKDLRTDAITSFNRQEIGIEDWQFKHFAAHPNSNFIAATESKLLVRYKNNDISYSITMPAKKCRPAFIADCDIDTAGAKAVVIGGQKIYLYEFDTNGLKSGSLKQALHSVRFHPCDNTILIATDKGIMILNSDISTWRLIASPFSRAISVSEDGDTIAAAGNDSVFIVSQKELKKSLSIQELMLIKRLATETAEKVFSSTHFIEIFKNIKNPSLQQRLVKVFELNYQKLGYDECNICRDNFADNTIHSTHSFCRDCVEQLKEGNNSCPLCRAPIAE